MLGLTVLGLTPGLLLRSGPGALLRDCCAETNGRTCRMDWTSGLWRGLWELCDRGASGLVWKFRIKVWGAYSVLWEGCIGSTRQSYSVRMKRSYRNRCWYPASADGCRRSGQQVRFPCRRAAQVGSMTEQEACRPCSRTCSQNRLRFRKAPPHARTSRKGSSLPPSLQLFGKC